ncbi:hypothetical protein SMITH_594 [Smithella sp. ME-1]|nr:hypothetical protein SMITH_594 [Smithella sp. ME-1]
MKDIIYNFFTESAAIDKVTDKDQSVIAAININPGHQLFELFQTAVNVSYRKDFIHKTLP